MENKLTILWTTDNIVTVEKMVFMYAHNAILMGWWEEVTIVIWGASARLAAENKDVQAKLKEMQDAGVKIEACKACSDDLGVTTTLSDRGVDVKYWGQPLTDILKKEGKIITI
ncbi:MAG: DsrE family protein [Bacteroidales bacterium]